MQYRRKPSQGIASTLSAHLHCVPAALHLQHPVKVSSSENCGIGAVPNPVIRCIHRAQAEDETSFFPVVTYKSTEILSIPADIALLRGTFRRIMDRHPFRIT